MFGFLESGGMWEEQDQEEEEEDEEDDEEDQGLSGQLLSDLIASNKYGELMNLQLPHGKGEEGKGYLDRCVCVCI